VTPIATVSTVDALAAELRDAILSGLLGPATRLNEVALARTYGVGRHTLRAAIARLAADGLVRQEPRRGAFVRVAERADLDDLHRFRRALELGALDLALEQGAGFAAATVALERLTALPPDAAWPAITDAHNAIHAAIVDASASPRFRAAFAALAGELALFVRQVRPAYPHARLVELHRRLLAELASGDPARARAALARDLDDGQAALRAGLDAARVSASRTNAGRTGRR
jgi:DNA-binding GntR family transcriptional regulator